MVEVMVDPLRTSGHAHGNAAAALGEGRERFLAFVRSRVGDAERAEDIIQEGLLRALKAEPEVPDEALVPWFYRVLNNAIIDSYRREAARNHVASLMEWDATVHGGDDEQRVVCECFRALLPNIAPQYADILESLDLDDQDPAAYAETRGITQNNLKVRRHRARQALRRQLELTCRTCAQHHCLDCDCA
jgi:RNA polymerase sigma factor (sigma-70 family)